MMTNLKEDSVTLDQFLKDFKLEISKYQRPYLWSGKQAINLAQNLANFTSTYSDGPLYYVGTFILVKKNDVYEIIDGQQRIVTLLILAKLLGNDVGENKTFKIISEKSKQNIKSNAGYLKDWKEKSNCKIDFDKINLTYIIADDDDQAFKFYTTLSTSGKPLNGIDIIKPFHLQSVAKDKQEQKAKDLEKYQFDEGKLEIVVKILLRSRYWQAINFRNFPRDYDSNAWKIVLQNEFVENASCEGGDRKYINGRFDDQECSFIPNYDLRQPLNKGENTIAFLLYFCNLWDQIKDKISEEILSKLKGLKGIDFNIEYYHAALLTYVSRYGEKIIKEADFIDIAKLLFKVCFYPRLNKPVRKDSVFNWEAKYHLLDRIANSYEKKQIFEFCENFYDESIIIKYKNEGLIANLSEKVNIDTTNRKNPFF